MKLQTADHAPIPGLTLSDNLWRARHHAICTAGCESHVAQMRAENPEVKLYGYVQPTRMELPWTMTVLGWGRPTNVVGNMERGCANYVNEYGFDGLFIDTPFEGPGTVQDKLDLLYKIEMAIRPARTMINFGDFGTFTASPTQNQLASALSSFGKIFGQAFVQVGIEASVDTATYASAIIAVTRKRADQGKLIVLGIYAPNGEGAAVAQAVAPALDHPLIYLHYHTHVPTPEQPGAGMPETMWCPWWEL